jgi:hypothetical protein
MEIKYRVVEDCSAENPNEEDCFIVYDHREFTVEKDGFEPERIWEYLQLTKRFKDAKLEDFEDCSQEAAEYSDYLNLHEEFGAYNIYPLYAYIHSGIALSLGNSYPFDCKWDTSMSGFLITTKDYQLDIKRFIETWNDYLMNGGLMVELYSVKTCECCNSKSEEFIDLIGGFYDYNEAEKYGKEYCTQNQEI